MVSYSQERRQEEEGFTLIELMVVVLIMGILMAIAIPTFLSTQSSAKDAGAKSNVTNAFTSEKAYFEDNQTFLNAGTTAKTTLDANLPWTGSATTAASSGTVQALAGTVTAAKFAVVASPATTGLVLLVEDLSPSGNCFYIFDNETSSSAPVLAYAESSAGCTAAPTAPTSVNSANAGAHIATTAGGDPGATWYASW